jgi:transposase InsO family protein
MLALIVRLLLAGLQSRRSLVLENLALRHQVEVLKRNAKRPHITNRDRALWVILSRIWSDWRRPLLIVRPDTVVRWHRAGFRLYWRLKSQRRRCGRPRLTLEERELIRRLARENPLWGAPRIHGELLKLGVLISQSTVAKYMKTRRPPSQSWKTFLANHARGIASVDFFEVPTAAMRSLYAFLVLAHDRRKVLGFEVTDAPNGEWAAEQVIEALEFAGAPVIVLRDGDHKYGDVFRDRLRSAGLADVRVAPHSPWQNGYAERVIGTIRRECLDHVIVFGADHLRKVLAEYLEYYHRSRTHLGLEKDCPIPRAVEPRAAGEVVALPVLGGLHHRYLRRAA